LFVFVHDAAAADEASQSSHAGSVEGEIDSWNRPGCGRWGVSEQDADALEIPHKPPRRTIPRLQDGQRGSIALRGEICKLPETKEIKSG
jgi:hypothetical protein